MDSKKVVVVGAGPVGSLAALYFSHAGWEVELYELRGGSIFALNPRLVHSKLTVVGECTRSATT